jgi:hypothetical protein
VTGCGCHGGRRVASLATSGVAKATIAVGVHAALLATAGQRTPTLGIMDSELRNVLCVKQTVVGVGATSWYHSATFTTSPQHRCEATRQCQGLLTGYRRK